MLSMRAYTASAISMWLAPGWGITTTPTIGMPFIFM